MDIDMEAVLYAAIGVVGLVEWLKAAVGKKKLKERNLVPIIVAVASVVLGVSISFVGGSAAWQEVVVNTLAVLAVSVIGYETVVETIQSLIGRIRV